MQPESSLATSRLPGQTAEERTLVVHLRGYTKDPGAYAHSDVRGLFDSLPSRDTGDRGLFESAVVLTWLGHDQSEIFSWL